MIDTIPFYDKRVLRDALFLVRRFKRIWAKKCFYKEFPETAYTRVTGYLSFYDSGRYGLQECCHLRFLLSPKNREGEKINREGDFLKREDDCSKQIVSGKKS